MSNLGAKVTDRCVGMHWSHRCDHRTRNSYILKFLIHMLMVLNPDGTSERVYECLPYTL